MNMNDSSGSHKSLFSSLQLLSDPIDPNNLNDHEFFYSMSYPKIGKCLIFNHLKYEKSRQKVRSCCEKDGESLTSLFQGLGFEVETCLNYTYEEIRKKLQKVSDDGFTDYSCFVCCVMTRGNENGELWAYDQAYNKTDLWYPFHSNRCQTLRKKPKIFVINACRGSDCDYGQKVAHIGKAKPPVDVDGKLSTSQEYLADDLIDGGEVSFPDSTDFRGLFPMDKDFLAVYSTSEGNYSFRSEIGSFFIQKLCDELKDKHESMDLISILTIVNLKIAYNFEGKIKKEPEADKLKQMPCFESSLTKKVKLTSSK